MSEQLFLAVTESSQVAEVRRQVVALADKIGFGETDQARVAVLVTEAATNIVKHAGQGEIVARLVESSGGLGIEVLALDQGPGILNPAESLRDGYSTAGSPGTGLGAINRLAGRFDFHSVPTRGVAVLAQLWPRPGAHTEPTNSLDVGAVCRARANETICGDGWETASLTGRALFLVVDGLGHGLGAATAAQEARRVFRANVHHNPARIVDSIHAALRATRGAVLGVAELAGHEACLRYAGVGNISGVIVTEGSQRHLVSMNGTVGHDVRKIQEFSYPWPDKALLILHSDGLASHWSLDDYPGLIGKPVSLVAGVLYRDHQRKNDDVTVLAARPSFR